MPLDTSESGLIVPVPDAIEVVEPWARRLDTGKGDRVDPHVTVLYPFMPPASWDAELTGVLATMFAAIPRFSFSLTSMSWFEPNILWAVPTPGEPFERLTAAVRRSWPDLRPYGGGHPATPHLTIGISDDRAALEQAARGVAAALPISCDADEVRLVMRRGLAEAWTVAHRFSLGSTGAAVVSGR